MLYLDLLNPISCSPSPNHLKCQKRLKPLPLPIPDQRKIHFTMEFLTPNHFLEMEWFKLHEVVSICECISGNKGKVKYVLGI